MLSQHCRTGWLVQESICMRAVRLLRRPRDCSMVPRAGCGSQSGFRVQMRVKGNVIVPT